MKRKLFWIAFWATLALMFLLGACTTERGVVRYVERHPATLDQWITTDTVVDVQVDTVYLDTTVYVYLPGETVRDSVPVLVPVNLPAPIISDTAKVATKLASARAWITGNKIHLELIQHDTTLQIKFDSLLVEYRRLEKQYVEAIYQPPPVVKKVRWWAYPSLIIAIFATALLVISMRFRK